MPYSDNMKENLPLKSNIYNNIRSVALKVVLLALPMSLYGQEIDFGSYVSSSVVVLAERDLDFGLLLRPGSSNVTLGSGFEGVVSMEGIRYLDAFVTISPYPVSFLYLNGDDSCVASTCRVAFDMITAYTNSGQAFDVTSGAVVFSGATVRFPFRTRPGGPPRPPPVPPHAGYTPPTDTAYLYIYGTATASIDANAGSYSNIITISVTYD
jgi:hypothetical protein